LRQVPCCTPSPASSIECQMVEPEVEAEKPKLEQLPINFGKKLAHTDKKVRDRGFKALKGWLRRHTELGRLDYLKLWRGLYFGMWMSDKRPVQQELAVQMALLINEIPRAKQGVWLDTFWETMQASWEKIDVHRMNKYLLFIRIVVSEAFKVVRVGGWQESEVKALGEIFLRKVPRHAKEGTNVPSIGLNLQFNRILWEELIPQLESPPEVSAEVMMVLLEPFCSAAEGSALSALVKNIHKYILTRTPPEFAGKVIFRLLQGAARKDIPKANREALYETVDSLERQPQAPAKPAAAVAAAPANPAVAASKPERGAPEAGREPVAAASAAAEQQAVPMKKKRRRRSTGEGAAGASAPPEEDGVGGPAADAEAAGLRKKRAKKRRRAAGDAGDASAAAGGAEEQVSPLMLPKAAIPACRRQATTEAVEGAAAPAASAEVDAAPEGQQAVSTSKRRRRGAGAGSPEVTAPVPPSGAASKGPPR